MSQPDTAALIVAAVATFVAAGLPALLILLRHDVRLGRLRMLLQLERAFRILRDSAKEGRPSFEYVRGKYMEDIPDDQKGGRKNQGAKTESVGADGNVIDDLAADCNRAASYGWFELDSSRVLLVSAIPYIVMCAAGMFLLMLCVAPENLSVTMGQMCEALGLMGGLAITDGARTAYFENILTVTAMAFLGAYIFSLGILARALATFDLSPMVFVRIAINVLTAVAAVVVAYRSFPDLAGWAAEMVGKVTGATPDPTPAQEPGAAHGLQRSWFVAAFVFGLIPDLAINFVISSLQRLLGAKPPRNEAFDGTKSVPLDVIDGIDFFIRFRLQQADIYEVQNLAVANPIMLFVETPYGIYQCIDWVAQAQLCTAVGAERFVTLRRYNIRTIFDLERALISKHTTSQLRRLVVAMMLSTPPEADTKGGWTFWSLKKSEADPRPGAIIGSATFGQYVADLLAQPAEGTDGKPLTDDPDRTLKHLGRIIIDDLHVHRLRQIWHQLSQQLGKDYGKLSDTEDPDEPDAPEPVV